MWSYNGHAARSGDGDGAWCLDDGYLTFDDVWHCRNSAVPHRKRAGAHLTLLLGSCHSGACAAMDFSEIVAYARDTFGAPVTVAEALRQPLPDWSGPAFTAQQLEGMFQAQKPDTEVFSVVQKMQPAPVPADVKAQPVRPPAPAFPLSSESEGDLFSRLAAARRAQGGDAAQCLQNSALWKIVQRLPRTVAELAGVEGVGARRAQKHHSWLLKVIADFVHDHEPAPPPGPIVCAAGRTCIPGFGPGAAAARAIDTTARVQAYRLRAGGARADPQSGSILFGWFDDLTSLALNGHGTAVSRDGSTYCGEFVGTEPHGRGVMAHADGAIHWGEWSHGQAHGVGVSFDPAGSMLWCPEWMDVQTPAARPVVFVGQMRNGQRHRGLLVCGTAYAYEGEFVDGKPHGRGCDYNAQSDTQFDGPYVRGQRHGVGDEVRRGGTRWVVTYDRDECVASTAGASAGRALLLACAGTHRDSAAKEDAESTVHLPQVAQDVARLQGLFVLRRIAIDAGGVSDAKLTRALALERLTHFFSATRCTDLIVTYNGHGRSGDGAWRMHDGFVTFDDVWLLWCTTAHLRAPGAQLTIVLGCCHSGAWVDITRDRALPVSVQSAANALSTVRDGRFTEWWCRYVHPGLSRAEVLQQLNGEQPRAYTNRTGPLRSVDLPLPLFDAAAVVPQRLKLSLIHVRHVLAADRNSSSGSSAADDDYAGLVLSASQ